MKMQPALKAILRISVAKLVISFLTELFEHELLFGKFESFCRLFIFFVVVVGGGGVHSVWSSNLLISIVSSSVRHC